MGKFTHMDLMMLTMFIGAGCLVAHAQPSSSEEGASFPDASNSGFDCAHGLTSFELVTGYVLTSPQQSVTMVPGVLQLSDCLDKCHKNRTCRSINFETGLCVLLTTAATDKITTLTQSQFPVFTIFAQKICVSDLKNKCTRGWAFERVLGFELRNNERKRIQTTTRLHCMQACLSQRDFECRSVNYDPESGECSLSDMDRASIVPTHDMKSRTYGPSTGGSIEYIENNCIEEPKKMCDFRPQEGGILKTVDFVYQNVKTVDECRERCLASPYKCHSFDLGDPNNTNHVCRTSHLDRYSLAHISDAYLRVPGSVTYELHSCYNVTIECKSHEMVAKVKTSKVFDGKIYAKSKPNLCVNDISKSLDFEIRMRYHDVDCAVKETAPGQFANDIVIQHHDMIVTTKDLGFSIQCKYDLSNRSITNNVNLAVDGDVDATDSQSTIVNSPNVTMRITDRTGSNIQSAQVGDALMIRFEIVETSSPFEIFVRELVAIDGQDQSEIVLIDSNGCPTDSNIMGSMNKIGGERKAVEGPFDAFKFPTSETVQFRALITPCLPTCEPVQCNLRSYDGALREIDSFGRRRRRRRSASNDMRANEEEILVAGAIQIKDKFQFKAGKKNSSRSDYEQSLLTRDREARDEQFHFASAPATCMNIMGLVLAGSCFLLAQLVLLLTWVCVRRVSCRTTTTSSTSLMSSPSLSTSRLSPLDYVNRKMMPHNYRQSSPAGTASGYDMFFPSKPRI